MPQNPLKMIADNPVVYETLAAQLRSKFDDPTSYQGLPPNVSNDLLGQIMRARIEGLMKVEEVLSEIAGLATIRGNKLEINPAR